MQRAERAGGYGDRLPAHHMRAAALSGPVEGGGVLSPLLAHHPGHLTGDPHGRLRAHLEDKRARRLQSGGEAAGEDLHDAALAGILAGEAQDRKSTRLNSSHTVISYAVFCLKKKKKRTSTQE